MNILHTVQFYHPSVGGSQEVVKQLSERLVARGHRVTVATSFMPQRKSCTVNDVEIEQFKVNGNEVSGFDGEVRRYEDFLRDGKYDIMLNYAAQQWATDLAFRVLNDIPYRKVLVPCGFSALFQPEYNQYFASLPQIMQAYDHLIFHAESYRDIDYSRRHGMPHMSVIPNGASEEEFSVASSDFRRLYDIPAAVPLMLTVGSHTGAKGHRLVIDAFRRTHVKEGVLVIIGNEYSTYGCARDCQRRASWHNQFSFGRKRILVIDPPRADVVAAYQAADLFVFGSNIEYSPLVLFEAMAARTPFITTACGNAIEIVSWSGGGIIVPSQVRSNGNVDADPIAMAAAIDNLISRPDKRCALADAGYAAWRRLFTWDVIADQYEKLYFSVLNR